MDETRNFPKEPTKSTAKMMMMRTKSAFIQGLTDEEVIQIVKLQIVKDLPKSRYATKPAVSISTGLDRNVVYSHIEIYKMVEEAAHVLRENGVRPKTVVAMVFDNSVEAVVTFLALEWVHAIAAPVSPELDPEMMGQAIANVSPSVVIARAVEQKLRTGYDLYSRAEIASKSLNLPLWDTWRTTNRGVFLDTKGVVIGDPAWHGGSSDYTLDPDEDAVLTHALDVDMLVLPLTHTNICSAAKIFTKTYELSSSGATLWSKPIYDVHGILILMASFYSGGLLVIPPEGRFEPEEFWSIVTKHNITWVSTDATMISHIKGCTEAPPSDHKLRFIRISGGYIDPREFNSYETSLGVPLLESYGLPETSGIAATNTEFQFKPGTMGQTCDGVDIAIFSTDPDNREMLEPGELGDIAVKGDNVTLGYLNDEVENKFGRIMCFNREEAVEEWFATGDRGELDEEGYLIVYGSARDARAEEVRRRQELREAEEAERAAAAALLAEEKARRDAEEASRRAAEEKRLREQQEAQAEAKRSLAAIPTPAAAGAAMMVLSTMHGQELTSDELQNEKYNEEWMTIRKFMGVEQPRFIPDTSKKVFIRKVEPRDETVPLPEGYEEKKRHTVHFNTTAFEYFYDNDEDQDTIETVLHTIPDWDTETAVSETTEYFQLIAMTEEEMRAQRQMAEEEFLRRLREEEETLRHEGYIRLLEDQDRLNAMREQELLKLREVHQLEIQRKLDEAFVERKNHYDALLEEEKQRQAAEYLAAVEAQRKVQADEMALALAYLEQRKADEVKRGLMLAEREAKNEVMFNWEEQNVAEADIAMAERGMKLEQHEQQLRTIEEENLLWKEKMRTYLDDTLTVMLTMYEKRKLNDEESYAKALVEIEVLMAKQEDIQKDIAAVYPKEQEELEKSLAEAKMRRVEVEREALKVRQELLRGAQAPQLMEFNLANIEDLVFEAAKAADDSTMLAESTEPMQKQAEDALAAANAAAAVAAGASTVTQAQVGKSHEARELAETRVPLPSETLYRASGYGHMFAIDEEEEDPDVIKRDILVDLEEIDDVMILHPAVEQCVSSVADNAKTGVEIRSTLVLAKGSRCSEQWLRLHAQSRLPAASVPSSFRAVSSIPAGTSREAAAMLPSKQVDFQPSKDRMLRKPTWSHTPKAVET